VLTGAGSEKELTAEVAKGIGENCINLAGETNIPELAAVTQQCDLFISNDTGVMHVAYAAGTKVLAIFGGRFYEHIWYPYGDGNKVIRKDIECSLCHADKCPLYDEPKCLAQISPDEVLEQARLIMDAKVS
jgi:ADP-heptose:LPS heptosyltransferase